jgi:hypothetical protein
LTLSISVNERAIKQTASSHLQRALSADYEHRGELESIRRALKPYRQKIDLAFLYGSVTRVGDAAIDADSKADIGCGHAAALRRRKPESA